MIGGRITRDLKNKVHNRVCKSQGLSRLRQSLYFLGEVIMNKLPIAKIFSKTKKPPTDITAYEDLFSLCRNIEQEDFALVHSTKEEPKREFSTAVK